ncbi:PHP domain-containing protein, partial [bacterium]|nr:PHP domain-containing protein [Candidatus Elulimicrobium humile]
DFEKLRAYMKDSPSKVEEYFSKAKSLGMLGLATTDHGNIHSWLDFYEAARSCRSKSNTWFRILSS